MTHRLSGVLCAVLVLLSSNVHAMLIDNGNGLIYDDDLNITWLANAYSGGDLTWGNALTWADSLTVGGATNWRLPSADSCTGPTCSEEFNHLFYNELGGSTGTPITGNVGLFSNIRGVYWTSEDLGTEAGVFYFGNATLAGTKSSAFKTGLVAVWAVHDGNIVAPIPAAIWLFGSGLLGLFGLSRRR